MIDDRNIQTPPTGQAGNMALGAETAEPPLRTREAIGAVTPDGVNLMIERWKGNGTGRDILFIHGFSQSRLCWNAQLVDPSLAAHDIITFDLRGHGESSKPDNCEQYRQSRLWADELRTVMTASKAHRPVVVAWSYAGRVLLDFVTHYGTDELAGIVLVNATSCGRAECYGTATPALAAMQADRLDLNVAATVNLWESCTAEPLPEEITRIMIASNMVVPPYVRRHLSGRPADYEEACRSIAVPTLVIHGEVDEINTLAMGRYSATTIPDARLKVYESTGHAPFLERPHRFGRDLASFVAGLA